MAKGAEARSPWTSGVMWIRLSRLGVAWERVDRVGGLVRLGTLALGLDVQRGPAADAPA